MFINLCLEILFQWTFVFIFFLPLNVRNTSSIGLFQHFCFTRFKLITFAIIRFEQVIYLFHSKILPQFQLLLNSIHFHIVLNLKVVPDFFYPKKCNFTSFIHSLTKYFLVKHELVNIFIQAKHF